MTDSETTVTIPDLGEAVRHGSYWMGNEPIPVAKEPFEWVAIEPEGSAQWTPEAHGALADLRDLIHHGEDWAHRIDEAIREFAHPILLALQQSATEWHAATVGELEDLLGGESVQAYIARCEAEDRTGEALYRHYRSLQDQLEDLEGRGPVADLPDDAAAFRADLLPVRLDLTSVVPSDGGDSRPAVVLVYGAPWLSPRTVVVVIVDGAIVQVDLDQPMG